MYKKDRPADGRIPMFIAFAAVAILIISSTVVVVVHDTDGESVVSGIVVDGLTYDMNVKKHTATVTGFDETYTDSSIFIPGTITYDDETYRVTAVANGAFDSTSTGREFRGKLTFGSPEDPSNIATIGFYAFNHCFLTGTLTIPSSVTNIGDGAFYRNNFTGDLVIPSSVTEIRLDVFRYCSFDGTLTVCGHTYIGEGAFKDTNFKAVNIFGSDGFGIDIFITDEGKCTVGSIFIADGVLVGEDTFPWKFYESESATDPLSNIQNKYFEINSDRTKMIKVEDRYAVHFDTQGGSEKLPVSVKEKFILPSASEVTKEGYTLLGWDKDGSVTNPKYKPGKTFTNDDELHTVKLYAIWGGTATFDSMGGTPFNPKEGKGEIDLPTPESSSPFTFKGWYDGNAIYNGKYDLVKDVTLYAVWREPIPSGVYVLSFDLDGGKGTFSAVKMEAGTYTLPTTVPTKTGYTFAEWECGGTPYIRGQTVTVSNDMAFTAKWNPVSYTVAFHNDDQTMEQDFVYDVPQNLMINPFVKDGFTFKGWCKTQERTSINFTDGENVINLASAEGEVDLYAVWYPKIEIKNPTLKKGDSLVMDIGAETVKENIAVMIGDGIVPKDQYSVSSANGRHTMITVMNSYTDALPTGNYYVRIFVQESDPYERTFTVKGSDPPSPTPKTHSVTFDTDGGSDAPKRMIVQEGQSFRIPDYKGIKDGFTFGGWSYNGRIYYADDIVIMGSSDMVMKALWAPEPGKHTVAFNTDGGSDAPKTIAVEEGSTFTIPEYKGVKAGFTFKEWSCSNGKMYVAGDVDTMGDKDLVMTAVWIADPAPSDNNTGLIIGIVVGAVAVIALIGGVVYFVKKR